MFTLKLYQNGPLPPNGRSVIVETVGLWVKHLEGDVKELLVFKKKVGVEDQDGTMVVYVGGTAPKRKDLPKDQPLPVFCEGDDNYFTWGVLENSQGKTTEIFR